MKKITLLILFSFFSLIGYSQLQEGFESGIPSAWSVFDNGVGTAQSWTINSTVATPPIVYQGTNAAYVNRENIGQGNTSEDYLATPLVTIPANGQLRFYTRSFTNGNQGTIYQIKVAPSTATQNNPAAYTLLQQWDETTLNTTFNIYEEKVISLSAYAGQQIYVSFVKVYTQPTTTLDGDRWLVDNVSIVQQCLDPTALTANGITQTSANLSWGNPSGATSWEIEVLPSAGTPTGTGVVYNGTLPYTATATATGTLFTPSTAYKYYVRALCSSGASSLWVGPFQFSTTSPGFTCAAPIIIGNIPYSTTDSTANYGDTTDVAQPAACAGTATNYMTGNDVFYSYTPTANSTISITMTPTANWSGIFVYAGCSNVGVTCIAGVANTGGGVRSIPSIPVVAGQQYIIVISTNATPQTVGYTLVIQTVNCAVPTTLSVSGITQTSAQLSWANPGGATSWEVAVQTAGSPIPSGSGVTVTTNTNYLVSGLTQSTAYQYYVRADCGNGTFSAWAGPFLFNTQCGAFTVPFQEGFNSTSTTQQCWSVVNANNDTDLWNMDYATNPFEGNQVAAITTDFNAGANDDWLISPQIILNGNQRLKFHYRVQSTTEPNDFRVMISTTGNAPANFTNTLIPIASYNNITYAQRIVSLAGYTGPVNIAWHVPAGGLDGWRLYIDNVIIEDLPTCPEPTALVSSNVLSTTATISWTNGNTESAWQVLALPCGSPAPTAGATGFIDVTSNPYNFTGLTPATCYDVYVRAVCSPTDSSPWSGPLTFTTQVAPPVCGGTFTDPGGPSANYANSTNSTVTICPNPGEIVTVTFTAFALENNFDFLKIYDGNDATAPLLANLTGTTLPPSFTSSANSGCLTFVFTSDGSIPAAGWIANVTCAPAPNCQKPTSLTATNITSTSALLGWTEPSSTVTQWEVIVLPFGSPAPIGSSTGTIVSVNPVLFTGLNPGTQYTFYVRGICPTSGTSNWSSGVNFTTLIVNDDCSSAIFAPVNQSSICQQVTPGTISGATATLPAPVAPCVGTADDDVWFQFVASNPFLTVSLQNIVGSTTNLNFAVYSGSCGTLTQAFCSAANSTSGVVNGLTIGQTYYIRVYSNASTPQTVNFNLCISTPASCLSGQAACQNLSYQNTTGVANQGTIGCLLSSPNPAYYTINVLTSGPINLLLTQSTTQGGAPNLDVDYAAWGPFTNQTAACAAIGNPPTLTPGIGVPVTTTTGCSFSAASTENLNITNAIAGQIYVILITNYSNQPGFISLTQTNATSPGAGFYECCPDAYFTYNPVTYCKSTGAQNPVAVISPGSLAGVFSLSPASPTGLVFANTSTGEIDLANSAPGNYLVLNTVAATASCAQKQRGYNISIVEPTSATISYNAASYCKSVTTLQNVTLTGTTGGTFSAIPNGGLSINPSNGDINPSLSSPGLYTVSYSLPGSGVCSSSNPTALVEIIANPNIPQPAPVSVCNTYTLPALSVGNYYTQLGGLGTPIDISVPITTSQTVYLYANNNGCSTERTLNITINTAQTPTLNVTQTSCTVATGTIEVTAPLGTVGGLPTDLFISEVTDAAAGSLTYVEIFNGTGASKDLSNYRLKVYNNGLSTASCDLLLSGIIANNATNVIKLSSDANISGVTPNQSFTGCGGVNIDDNIRLTSSSNVEIDNWGRTDGVTYTPLNQPGYTYRRNNTAVAPSLTWNTSDWTALDPEDYTNIGSYTPLTSGYQYSLDNGTYQTGTTFNSVLPGDHTVTVLDLATGCYSNPVTVTINAVPVTPIFGNLTTISPICSGGNAVFSLSGTPNATVTYTINNGVNQTVLLDSNGTGTVTVNGVTSDTTILLSQINLGACNAILSNTANITVNPLITPVTSFSYVSPICAFNADNQQQPILGQGFTIGGQFQSTTGLSVNANTGVITVSGSDPGTYTVIYIIDAQPNNCQLGGTSSAQVTVSAPFQISVEAGCQSVNYVLTALPIDSSFNPETSSYSWQNASGQIVGTTQSITVTEPGNYFVSITSNGCSSNSLPVTVDSINCVIQKGISVNNDGKNDTFDLRGFNVKKLTIFNRYGMKVYDKNNYTNQWGGQSSDGDELPDGTYYYVIERDGGNKTGWIYINRAQ